MTQPPDIAHSTAEERLRFIRGKYPCIANCEQCGNCAVFRGRDPERAFADYIDGRRGFMEVLAEWRGGGPGGLG